MHKTRKKDGHLAPNKRIIVTVFYASYSNFFFVLSILK